MLIRSLPINIISSRLVPTLSRIPTPLTKFTSIWNPSYSRSVSVVHATKFKKRMSTAGDINSLKRPHSPSPVEIQQTTLGKNEVIADVATIVESSTTETKEPQPKKQFKKKLKKFKQKVAEPTSPEGVLLHDIEDLVGALNYSMDDAKIDVRQILNFEGFREARIVECEIIKLNANGDGLAVNRLHELAEDSPERTAAIGSNRIEVLVVPFVVPGDKVKVKLYRAQTYYQLCDLVEVFEASPDRDDSLVNCQYFAKCSGCQFQMMSYDKQLLHKQKVIANAYKYFSELPTDLVPAIDPCVASPLEYNYRTKLTPHFDVPRKKSLTELPPIGFGMKGRSAVVDIEECSIGTPIINQGMKEQREIVKGQWASYKRGVTILLRENTSRTTNTDVASETKECVTNPKQIITEFVENYRFEFPAGSFFQNNNSILPLITDYVRSNLRLSSESKDGPKYLVDAYCGSGLFSITCSTGVESVIGVEISADSVRYAEINAKLNNVQNTKFIVGEAEKIFADSLTPADETSVILDPPRKGCDTVFLDQLITYLPKKIVYISCNVHSQARDIGYLLKTGEGKRYKIESIRGFDFFPQTHHIESVAVLSLQ